MYPRGKPGKAPNPRRGEEGGQSYELRTGEGTKRKGREEEWIPPKDKKDVTCERLNEAGRARGGGAFPQEPVRAQEGDGSQVSMGKVKRQGPISYH